MIQTRAGGVASCPMPFLADRRASGEKARHFCDDSADAKGETKGGTP